MTIEQLLRAMEQELKPYPPAMVQQLKILLGPDPFMILISCLLSLRSRDEQTQPLFIKLWPSITTPEQLLAYPPHQLEEIVRPLGFWRRKTAVLRAVSEQLIERFDGQVPADEAALLSLPGVGRKTAHLVMSEAFSIPALCVDTHVHRIANHLGLVKTKTPQETEKALERVIPRPLWSSINRLFVPWGQFICRSSARTCRCFDRACSSKVAEVREVSKGVD